MRAVQKTIFYVGVIPVSRCNFVGCYRRCRCFRTIYMPFEFSTLQKWLNLGLNWLMNKPYSTWGIISNHHISLSLSLSVHPIQYCTCLLIHNLQNRLYGNRENSKTRVRKARSRMNSIDSVHTYVCVYVRMCAVCLSYG